MAAYLTTKDNPFNPKTQYEEWSSFDHAQGYYTEQYLASQIPDIRGNLPDLIEKLEADAIDEIVRLDIFGRNYVRLDL